MREKKKKNISIYSGLNKLIETRNERIHISYKMESVYVALLDARSLTTTLIYYYIIRLTEYLTTNTRRFIYYYHRYSVSFRVALMRMPYT